MNNEVAVRAMKGTKTLSPSRMVPPPNILEG